MSGERKQGRRPGDPAVTKHAILQAAREVFSDAGFERATMRSIASRAGVDPALIHHHFGTKQDLFAAAHELPLNPAVLISQVAEAPRDQISETLVRVYLGALMTSGSPALSLLKAATTNESAARMLREFIQSILLDNAKRLTDQPDPRLRVALIGSHMIGIVFARLVVGIPEVTRLEADDLVAILVPMVERYLFEPL